MRFWHSDGFIVLAGTTLAVAIVSVVVVCLIAIGNRLSFPMEFARMEQLRRDAANVDAAQAEDVIGQVTESNRRLASVQACNQAWYCDFVHTDKWNSVAFIPVPQRAK